MQAGQIDQMAAGIGDAVSTEAPGWQERAGAITGDAPVVRAIDSVGGEAADDIASLLAPGGTLVSFGAMSGKPLMIGSGQLIFRGITVKGFWGAQRSAELGRETIGGMIGEIIAMAASGALRLPVDATFPLDQAALAAAASDQPGRVGKIVLRP